MGVVRRRGGEERHGSREKVGSMAAVAPCGQTGSQRLLLEERDLAFDIADYHAGIRAGKLVWYRLAASCRHRHVLISYRLYIFSTGIFLFQGEGL